MSIIIYGIKNCDTCRKAYKWAKEKGYNPTLHDFRKDGLDSNLLNSFIEKLGWQSLINTRSLTWRQLDKSQKENIDKTKTQKLINENPTLIKRPIFKIDNLYIQGFKPKQQEEIIKSQHI